MLHPCCKTLQYTEPLLVLSPRGPAEPTGLPDNLGPLRELLKTTFCQVLPDKFITLVLSTKLVEITGKSRHVPDLLGLRTQEQS